MLNIVHYGLKSH